MFCRKCGKSIPEGSRFCPECGMAQFGDDKPDSEFREWRKKRILFGLRAGIGLLVLGLVIKNLPIALVGAATLLISSIKLNNLNKQ